MPPLSDALGCPASRVSPTPASLKDLFEWFLGLRVPYETVSNVESGTLIKSPPEMVESVRRGFGGHCVEHAALFTAILQEHGFDATFANADFRPSGAREWIGLAKPLTLVAIGTQRFVCDPYYRRTILTVPTAGEECHGRFTVRRIDSGMFIISATRDGAVTSEDRVHEGSSLDHRRELFASRYAAFSPFGITSPYYQVLKPVHRAIYYDPESDGCVTHDDVSVHELADGAVEKCVWIPAHIRALIPRGVAENRRDRTPALEFLRRGQYVPQYRRLTRDREAGRPSRTLEALRNGRQAASRSGPHRRVQDRCGRDRGAGV